MQKPEQNPVGQIGVEAPPTRFADIVTLVAALPPLLSATDEFRTAVLADARLSTDNRATLLWLGRAQRRFPPQLNLRPEGTTHAGFALYAGPHAEMACNWPTLLGDWHTGTSATSIALTAQPQVELELHELVEAPIADSRHGPALTETQAAHAMAYGMLAAKADLDLLALSTVNDAASGAETSALAVIAALTKHDGASFTSDVAQAEDITARLEANRSRLTDPLTILATLGGHESCAIFGAILAARLAGIPVLLEGLPALAAGMTLEKLVSTEAAKDLLGHVRATSLPTAIAARAGAMQAVLEGAESGSYGDGLQAATRLPRLRALANGQLVL